MASIFSARKKKSGLGGDGWKADYEDIGQGYGAGPGEAFLKSCTTHEVTREHCAEMCSAWENCQGFSQGHDHPGLSNTCIIFPAVGERDNCPEDGEDHAWEKFFHGDDEELVETFMGDDMDHMPVPFHTWKKAKHDKDSGPELHAGCRCDEEFFEPTQTCYKKCAILTEGAFANRSGTNSCCRGQPCHAGGHQHTSGFGCEGFGVDGDGHCPSRPSLARVDSKVCEKPAPEQLPLPPLRPSVQVKRSQDDHAARVEDGLEVPAAENEPTGSLAKLVDHALENHHNTDGKGHGLVMCFAKFSKFEGTKPAVKVKKFNRCYTSSAEEGEAEGEEESK